MANLRRLGSGPYHLELRFSGKKFQRSLRTKKKTDAVRLLGVVEQTVEYLERGVLAIRPNSSADDLWRFLLSGGKITPNSEPVLIRTKPLSVVCEKYFDSYTEGSKEYSTLQTERTHLSHFKKLMGKSKQLASITAETIEDYIRKRQQEPGIRGRNVSAITIGKELATFHLLWKFALSRGWANGENPATTVRKPRANQKTPFMTFEEIERRLKRGGLSDSEISELWDSLFLRENEIGEVLSYLKQASASLPHAAFVYPAIAFCAYTGARRSEMLRTRIDDINGRILLREKKRSQEHCITFREVPLHPELKDILDVWLDQHPGGQFLFCKKSCCMLKGNDAQNGINAALRGKKWNVLRGYHIFRHSFTSNLARHGVDQRTIDEFMGHQTDEMRKRYRHLFPEDTAKALALLSFAGTGK